MIGLEGRLRRGRPSPSAPAYGRKDFVRAEFVAWLERYLDAAESGRWVKALRNAGFLQS